MSKVKMPLLIPVENQVRELDSKLLLACIAARRGFSSVIGSRRELDFKIASFPRGIYLSKSMTLRSIKMFKIMRKLGHEIVAWDEEALVHLPPEIYFSRRFSPVAIGYLSHLFAWGQDNVDLWRKYPHLPPGLPIHITGNPRNDMMRPELRSLFAQDIAKIRDACGEFILVNTNFNHVNSFRPAQGLFQPVTTPGEEPRFGRSARGMTREFAEGFRDHKQGIFEDFKRLIPVLEAAFPEYTIVVRPHPTESHDAYHEIAARCERVRVTNEGNVIPWLLASRAVIHNGCTTGVEAFVLNIPAISYRATVNDYYDLGFYELPNRVSHQCFDFEQLRETLRRILAGEVGVPDVGAIIDHYLAARSGPMACERIVDVLDDIASGRSRQAEPPLKDRLQGHFKARKRRLEKFFKSQFPNIYPQYQLDYHRHRYPEMPLASVQERVLRFKEVLGGSFELKVEQVADELFRIIPD